MFFLYTSVRVCKAIEDYTLVGDDLPGIPILNSAHLSRSSDSYWDDNEAVKSSPHRLSTQDTRTAETRDATGLSGRKRERDDRVVQSPRIQRRDTPTELRRQHIRGYIYATSSVGEGLPRLGTRKTSFVEYPTGTAQPPSNSFNPLRKNQ